jgi:hypothetical protein
VYVFNDIFNEHMLGNLPPDVNSVIEEKVTQILTNCDMAFPRKAIADEDLFKALFDELVFDGSVAKPYLSNVELYFKE